MFSIDYNKLFIGVPYEFYDICYVYPLQLKQIIAMGEQEYNRQLGLLTLDKRELEKSLMANGATQDQLNYSVFEYLLISANFNEQFFLELQKAFTTFIKQKIHISIDTKEIYIGDISDRKVLNEENFEDFQMLLRAQNNLPVPEPVPKNENPMARKFRLRREQVAEAKRRQAKKNGEAMPLYDSISCLVCFDVGLDIEQIKNLTIYAFQTIFKRAQYKYKYDMDVRMIAAGADPKKIKPKNWLGKLD